MWLLPNTTTSPSSEDKYRENSPAMELARDAAIANRAPAADAGPVGLQVGGHLDWRFRMELSQPRIPQCISPDLQTARSVLARRVPNWPVQPAAATLAGLLHFSLSYFLTKASPSMSANCVSRVILVPPLQEIERTPPLKGPTKPV